MKKTLLIICSILLLATVNVSAQKPVIDLTFSSINDTVWVPLESITIKNITRGVDTTINYPDTVLTIYYQVGVDENGQQANGFKVLQNFPNPVKSSSTINIFVPEKGNVNISIMDAVGRLISTTDQALTKGYHTYSFIPGKEKLYFLTATFQGISSSIKIINESANSSSRSSLVYKSHSGSNSLTKSSANAKGFSFDKGDRLIYVGTFDDMESGIFDIPKADESYTFQFATNIPCPDIAEVSYEGQTYNTIQIYSQCWFSENLNVGAMIAGDTDMEDDNNIEKYCYNDEETNCDEYGGMYQWEELMQYETGAGSQGICPDGWHIPSSGEFIILSGAVDSQYSYGDPEWYSDDFNGFDAGLNLKSEDGWAEEEKKKFDSFGFTAFAGGQRISNGYFDGLTYKASFWSSEIDFPGASWYLSLSYLEDGVDRSSQTFSWGKSVRCIKD